jgi:hypothetical protein
MADEIIRARLFANKTPENVAAWIVARQAGWNDF